MTAATDTPCFTLFDTAIGPCGIAWGASGICGLQLPEASAQQTLQRMRQRFPAAQQTPPRGPVQAAMDAVVHMLSGQPHDFRGLTLDMQGVPPFLAAGDKPGGCSAAGGIRTKLRLLIIEGAMRGTPGLLY